MVSGIEADSEFNRNGFIAYRNFQRGETLLNLQNRVQRFLEQTLKTVPSDDVFYEDKSNHDSLKQIQRLHQHDPWFANFADEGPLKRIAEKLLQHSVELQNVQYFSKPPGVSRPTPPHQDGFYFMLNPCEAVTMWLALDDIDQQNGCVYYVPAWSCFTLRSHAKTSTLGFSQGIADYPTPQDRLHETPIPVSAGDLLVHHAKTIHRADANRSESRKRRALGFVYFSTAAKFDEATHTEYQGQLRADLRSAGRI